MSNRTLLTLLSTLLFVSLGVGLTGMLLSHTALTHTGILATLVAATGTVCTKVSHVGQLAEAEREAERQAGYRLALQHVALGLFDPQPSGGAVVPIRREFPYQHERQAQ